jgi:mannose/cellobiose epimerase-like protein (N-acyl-D-glucosamine 2-epimerase family)
MPPNIEQCDPAFVTKREHPEQKGEQQQQQQQQEQHALSKEDENKREYPDNFFSVEFLTNHIESIVNFYSADRVVDDSGGGYFQSFLRDGTKVDTEFRHLVSSARMVINFFTAGKLLQRQDLIDVGKHGLEYIENTHYDKKTRRYVFTLRDHVPEDTTERAYAYAFVLAAHASAVSAGGVGTHLNDEHDGDENNLSRIYDILEERFWLGPEGGNAYRETPHGCEEDDGYRGQNSNMHMCEALIAAFEATKDRKYLDRAKVLATTFTEKLIVEHKDQDHNGKSYKFVWEHYDTDFNVDWDYNKNDPTNIYRPWGFQPGHQAEWSKNLLNIHRYENNDNDNVEKNNDDSKDSTLLVQRAAQLFDQAWGLSWDDQFGGLVYGFDDDCQKWCDDEKYFWVQSESMATCALLWEATKDPKYIERYAALWNYVWKHWIDHKYGAWIGFKLTRENKMPSSENEMKAIAGGKCDYHTMMACVEALRVFK